MEITVQRDTQDKVCTQGRLLLDGVQFCYTLEPAAEGATGGEKPYCIPAGRYRATLYNSPHFGFLVPLLQDVPGFEAIEIHIGNSAENTHGCTLVAKSRTTDWQSDSRVAFEALMSRLTALPEGKEIWATYLDPPQEAA